MKTHLLKPKEQEINRSKAPSVGESVRVILSALANTFKKKCSISCLQKNTLERSDSFVYNKFTNESTKNEKQPQSTCTTDSTKFHADKTKLPMDKKKIRQMLAAYVSEQQKKDANNRNSFSSLETAHDQKYNNGLIR
ncbi:hypothetical protein [Enterococcus ratti]|uniref:Uncharacterized protein n=1 Tax=Enterococcus ratti TaxID=150033 RepID=A0A1L8WNM1_9ENTE|nr:hypothetical protein [Enterococcus ratti]OJG82629.1 hypothetical protein RV14_GL002204 [Enterococcus ratti]